MPKPINLSNPEPRITSSPPPRGNTTIPLLFTAGIFFALGYIIAILLGGGEDSSPTDTQEADTRPNEVAEVIVDADFQATLDSVDNPETVRSLIDIALQGTFIALTPTPTPVPPTPTRVPETYRTYLAHNPTIGPSDAPIQFIEFSDYQCPWCAVFHATVRQPLLEHYGDLVYYVFRDYPAVGLQSSAEIAGKALCANFQGKFWEYAELIWQNQNPYGNTLQRLALDDNALLMFAENAGLNVDDYTECAESSAGFDLVAQDYQDALQYGFNGTPAFLINGITVSGAGSLTRFMDIIDAELLRLNITPPPRPDALMSTPAPTESSSGE
jgi:protein-disulfide isomerase